MSVVQQYSRHPLYPWLLVHQSKNVTFTANSKIEEKTTTTTVTVLNGLSKSISRHGHNQMECNKPWLGFIKDCAIKFLVAGRLFICATAHAHTLAGRLKEKMMTASTVHLFLAVAFYFCAAFSCFHNV